MNINIKATNMELTDAISDYINKRLDGVNKFVKTGESLTRVEVGRISNHHKNGDVFKAEFFAEINGNEFYALSKMEDLYSAVDDAVDDLIRQITNNKNRKQTLFKRGATSVKKMMKGISDRNPFTSK